MENQHEQGIASMSKSMLVVMVLTMLAKFTGFFRETALASQYGISIFTDAFKTAQLLPCLFLSVLVTAISSIMIPAYSSRMKEGRLAADRFMNNLYTVGMAATLVILLLTTLLMGPIVNFFTREASDTQTRDIAYRLSMTMMPMGIFVFLAHITSAYLQANFDFIVPALSQLLLNLVVIAAILLSRGANIAYVAIGVVVGWAARFLVQVPSLRRTKLAYRPVFDLREPGLREVALLMIPVLISGTFDQVYISFDQMVAYRGMVGDPTALDYANRITTMVSVVLLTTIATVLFPSLVRDVDKPDRFRHTLSFGLNINLLIAIPAIVALVFLCVPITRLVYERGEFTQADSLLTATLLACYSLGILGVGLRELCNRCFYAYKETTIPMVVGVGAVLLNIGLNYALHPLFGAAGIALGTAIASTASGFTLLVLLQRRKRAVDLRRVLRCLWRTVAASGCMCAVLAVLCRALTLPARSGMSLLFPLGITCLCGLLTYLLVLRLLRTEELMQLLRIAKKRLTRT